VAELLIPADDEVALVAGLKPVLGVQVGTRIPPGKVPKEFVRIVSLGGSPRDLVSDTFRLAVEAFADTEGRARALCALAVAHAEAAGRSGSLGGVTCYDVAAEGLPGNLPLPSLPTHFRYTATVAAALRRASA